ncbi:tyrosine-type recombinase/integrase [Thermoproteota archaeon]
MKKKSKGTDLPKNWIIEQYENNTDITEEMKEKMTEFLLSLHGIMENSKALYISKIKMLGRYLTQKRKITRFEDAKTIDLDFFLAQYNNKYTLNVTSYVIKKFYTFLNLPELTTNFRLYPIQLEQITPSETLTPEEVIKLADEASKRRELYKVIILTLFESCARISEVLQLKLGDAIFTSVVDKEGHRKPIATLHFKRSKGGVKKQPVNLVMFASELKRWYDNHPYKSDKQAYLFPSPTKNGNAVTRDSVAFSLWNAAQRLGITKRINPHWLRHSGLSFFANNKNYNEQLLMWRAGWTNTSMARRYIHSGAELENNAYLERMGFITEKPTEQKITSKPCPHCQASNPYTNSNCDLCAMPLDLEEYEKVIEKKRDMERYYQTLDKMNTGKLDEEQEAEIDSMVKTIMMGVEIERYDIVKDYLKLTLISWAKMFVGK